MSAAILNRAEPSTGAQISAGPHRSLTILKERADFLAGELRIVSQLPVFPTSKPFRSTNPKASITPGEQDLNVAVGEMLTGWRLPLDGPNAIEANQAEFRTKPKITVGRLCHRVDEAFKKTFADCPRFVRVLINVKRWV
jgi:hypothetical protein